MNEQIAGLPVSRIIEDNPYINMLIYGSSGSGKTRLAGSSAIVEALKPVLFIDVEGGTLTLRNTEYNDVDILRVKTWAKMELVYNELYKSSKYKTVIIDSLTEIQKLAMDDTMSKLIESNEDRDADIPGIREWNINIERTRKYVRRFRDLPLNTIFTALDHTETNKMNGSIKRKPSLSGKVKDEVAAFLDVVVYLYTKEVGDENKRMLLTGQTETTIAKDRSGQLPMVIEDPTMQIIYDILNKGN